MKKNNIIAISFKNNAKEMMLYEYLEERTDKSAFIKDILFEYLGDAITGQSETKKETTTKKRSSAVKF